MSVLSVTFHITEKTLPEWAVYEKNELINLVEQSGKIKFYILSDVHSDMIQEGKNINLLMIFENEEEQNLFIEHELIKVAQYLDTHFGNEVMVFKTHLTPKAMKF